MSYAPAQDTHTKTAINRSYRIESNLGIIASNMALSRSMWAYFVHGSLAQRSAQAESPPYGSRNRAGYPKLPIPVVGINSTTCRRTSSTKSDASEIPLDPVIKKKIEISVAKNDGNLSDKEALEAEQAHSDWSNPGRADFA